MFVRLSFVGLEERNRDCEDWWRDNAFPSDKNDIEWLTRVAFIEINGQCASVVDTTRRNDSENVSSVNTKSSIKWWSESIITVRDRICVHDNKYHRSINVFNGIWWCTFTNIIVNNSVSICSSNHYYSIYYRPNCLFTIIWEITNLLFSTSLFLLLFVTHNHFINRKWSFQVAIICFNKIR